MAGDSEEGRVLEVVDGPNEESARERMGRLPGQSESLQALAMDIWPAFTVHDRFWKFEAIHAAERFVGKRADLAQETGLAPTTKVAGMPGNQIEGLLGYGRHPITEAGAEGINFKLQAVKSNSRGKPSFAKFRVAILFYRGKLEAIPR